METPEAVVRTVFSVIALHGQTKIISTRVFSSSVEERRKSSVLEHICGACLK